MPDCEIQIDAQALSSQHLTLERRGGDLVVTDLESANETFLNELHGRGALIPDDWDV